MNLIGLAVCGVVKPGWIGRLDGVRSARGRLGRFANLLLGATSPRRLRLS